VPRSRKNIGPQTGREIGLRATAGTEIKQEAIIEREIRQEAIIGREIKQPTRHPSIEGLTVAA
jgi:hypothetical protein